MDYDRRARRSPPPPPETSPTEIIQEYQTPLILTLATAILLSIIRQIYRSIQRRGARNRDRDWEARLRVEWEARLRSLGGIVSEQLVLSNPAPSQPAAAPLRGNPELAGWKGVKWGVPLGFGLGIVAFYGYVWGSAPQGVVLVMAAWWVVWVRRDDGGTDGTAAEVEMKGMEYQAAVFGVVLGVGFGVILGVGLHAQWKLELIAALYVLWALAWGMQGMGITWVEEGRKLRLSGFSMGGSRLNLFLIPIAGIRHVLLGISWLLMLLLGVIVWLYGWLSRLSHDTRPQGQETSAMTRTVETEVGMERSEVVAPERDDVGAPAAEERPQIDSPQISGEEILPRVSSRNNIHRDVSTWKK